MKTWLLVLNILVLLGYFVYYLKSGITGKLTYLFCALFLILSFFACKSMVVYALTVMGILFSREYGNQASKVMPVVVPVVFLFVGFLINVIMTKKPDFTIFTNLIYGIPMYIMYLIELSFVVYKEEKK